MAEEEGLEGSSIIKTPELFVEGKNEDPVTGYPFEVPELRRKLIGVLDEAIQKQERVVFVDGDIDYLKSLNDLCGKNRVNLGIEKVVREKEMVLLGLKEARAIYVYRPQAGGDEFRMLIILSEQAEGLTEEIREGLQQHIEFEYEEGKTAEIKCSFGYASRKFSGEEKPTEELQSMAEEAEEFLAREKAKKIVEEIKTTVETGRNLDVETYVKEISERWGSKRITEVALRIILLHLMVKAQAQLLGKERKK